MNPVVLAAAIWFAMGTAFAAAPDAGLRAEGEGRWVDAVEIYKAALKGNPAQADLWERIADIRATKLNMPARAAEALREASKYAPNDARLQHKLAQAYAAAQEPQPALQAINRALALEPNNANYLRMRGELATWVGDYATATESYQRLASVAPNDPETGLALARIMTERGDYAGAMEMLQGYHARFGESPAYDKQRARVLAWAQRPRAALATLQPLLAAEPENYDLHYTRTLALNANQQPGETQTSLATLTRLGPERRETRDIERFIKTPQRTYLTGSYGYHTDSDHVTIQPLRFEGASMLSPETRLFGGVSHEWLSAPAGSGLEHKNGQRGASYSREWVGAKHIYSPVWSIEGKLGAGQASGAGGNTIYEFALNARPADEWRLRLSGRQDLHDVSPRAVSLGIERRGAQVDAQWTPDLRYTIVGMAAVDHLSDGNDRWEWVLAPRRAVVRNETLNLDIGLSAQQYGFDRNPGNGYYAPRLYQRYAVTAFGYWRIDDDNGIGTSVSFGPFKDNTMTGFRNGGDVVVEGFFGIYRDWYLNLRAGYSHYGGGFARAYESTAFDIALTRRF